MYMEINNQGFVSIEQVTSRYFKGTAPEKEQSGNISFGDLLKEKVNEAGSRELKFSKHASRRLMDRNINLSKEQIDRLQKGAQLSNRKGIKESLVLMDEYAFIVNTGSNTVVTAMEKMLMVKIFIQTLTEQYWYKIGPSGNRMSLNAG